ncbi:MAG: ParB N-terminal domain-containing protein [Thermoplasmata archaeon]|nr:ParB N-terminal domain-containing protein [Thermoplasmata archaeon]
MSREPTFELVDIDRLKVHERIRPDHLASLLADMRRDGFVADPIWVARGSYVVLNGHHRLAALRELGARKVPAWMVDYDSESVLLDRWTPGPPLSKQEVEARASAGQPFPPKTTKHTVAVPLPEHRTLLADLGVLPKGGPEPRGRHARRPASSSEGS